MLIIKIDVPENRTVMREVERKIKSGEIREALSWVIAVAPSAITVEVEDTDARKKESKARRGTH